MSIALERAPISLLLEKRGLDRNLDPWRDRLERVTASEVEKALSTPAGTYHIEKLLALISPAAQGFLESMAQTARDLTLQRFGRNMRLFAPLYLSSYCVNRCVYCGFNAGCSCGRVRLSVEEALEEARVVSEHGIQDLLLVSGEDKNHVSVAYLERLAQRLRHRFSFVAMEIYQLEKEAYARLFQAGVEGVTLYQETYDRDIYEKMHPSGPKADYERRLRGADDIAQAGMREVGLGVLLGLADWRTETLALAEHAHHLMKRYWQSHLSISFPRLKPAPGVSASQFPFLLEDKELVQMILALRLCFADVGFVLSTREPAFLRDHLVKLGITRMSAGSKTNPGGYQHPDEDSGQFHVDDQRLPQEVAAMLREKGLEPVWKDWDKAFL